MPANAPTRIAERRPLLLVPVPGQAAWLGAAGATAAEASLAGLPGAGAGAAGGRGGAGGRLRTLLPTEFCEKLDKLGAGPAEQLAC